jgi:hypothetical protein
MHAQGGSQNAHLFFTPGLTDGNAFIAAQYQDVLMTLEGFDDLLNRFSICNNH